MLLVLPKVFALSFVHLTLRVLCCGRHNYLLTDLLTQWSTVLFEELIYSQL